MPQHHQGQRRRSLLSSSIGVNVNVNDAVIYSPIEASTVEAALAASAAFCIRYAYPLAAYLNSFPGGGTHILTALFFPTKKLYFLQVVGVVQGWGARGGRKLYPPPPPTTCNTLFGGLGVGVGGVIYLFLSLLSVPLYLISLPFLLLFLYGISLYCIHTLPSLSFNPLLTRGQVCPLRGGGRQ